MQKKILLMQVLMLIMSLLFLGSHMTGAVAKGKAPNTYMEYRVKPRDTLWDIAMSHADNRVDIRKYIYSIMDVNGMKSSDIVPGQVIFIPPLR